MECPPELLGTVLRLNVGGAKFETLVDTVWFPSEYFRCKLDFYLRSQPQPLGCLDRPKPKLIDLGDELIDQDPTAFGLLLNFWRGGSLLEDIDCRRYGAAFAYFGHGSASGQIREPSLVATNVRWQLTQPMPTPAHRAKLLASDVDSARRFIENPSFSWFVPSVTQTFRAQTPFTATQVTSPFVSAARHRWSMANKQLHIVHECVVRVQSAALTQLMQQMASSREQLHALLHWITEHVDMLSLSIVDPDGGNAMRFVWSGWQWASVLVATIGGSLPSWTGNTASFPVPALAQWPKGFPLCALYKGFSLCAMLTLVDDSAAASILWSGCTVGSQERRRFLNTPRWDVVREMVGLSVGGVSAEHVILVPPGSETLLVRSRQPISAVTMDVCEPDGSGMLRTFEAVGVDDVEARFRNGCIMRFSPRPDSYEASAALRSLDTFALRVAWHRGGGSSTQLQGMLAVDGDSVVGIRLIAPSQPVDACVTRVSILRFRGGGCIERKGFGYAQ